jgi:SagB-type dehydrogenase family enzyme
MAEQPKFNPCKLPWRWYAPIAALTVLLTVALISMDSQNPKLITLWDMKTASDDLISLPEPDHDSNMSLERAIHSRQSVRKYSPEPLTLFELSQMLWAAGGKTQDRHRTTPSAGGLYPLRFYVVAGKVQGLNPGVYKYNPQTHSLNQIIEGEMRPELSDAAIGQTMPLEAPATIIITGEYNQTTGTYGQRGIMYVHMEAGHSGQNIYLQAQTLGIGTVAVGAFNEEKLSELLQIPPDETPLYIYPVGKRKN